MSGISVAASPPRASLGTSVGIDIGIGIGLGVDIGVGIGIGIGVCVGVVRATAAATDGIGMGTATGHVHGDIHGARGKLRAGTPTAGATPTAGCCRVELPNWGSCGVPVPCPAIPQSSRGKLREGSPEKATKWRVRGRGGQLLTL